MARFRTRAVLSILVLILFTCILYLFFFLKLSNLFLQIDTIGQLQGLIILASLVVTCLSVIAALVVSFSLTRGITKPIANLVKATQAISNKDFNQHIKMRTYSEIEELLLSFNCMVEELKSFKRETERRSHSLEKIISERNKELSYIYQIGREVSSTLELSGVLDAIVKRTTEILDLKICTILLVDEFYADRLKVWCAQGINFKKIEREIIKPEEGISGWVWAKKEALLIRDINQDSRFIGRKKERYYTGSLISVPLEAEGKIIGVINGNNKLSGKFFKEADLLLLKEIATESAMAIENALLYKNLKEVYLHTISALARALEAKDHYTQSHSENVTKYAVAIAEELGLPGAQTDIIRRACQLHDLGKIGIHDYILTKSGKLSSEEWDEIKLHSLRGAQILEPISFLREIADLVRQHHERFDGRGYPASLSGQDIQLGARIMAVADAFDAMISGRPYRKPLGLNEAIAELKAHSGSQFDPGIVQIFLKALETRPELIKLRKDKN